MAKIAEVREVSLESLRPYERNAKIHGKEQIEKLKDSIREFGFVSPCLIDRDNNIIAGHGRVEAARELGMDTVPCVYIEGLTEEQRRAYILADNKISEMAEWDKGLVSMELEELKLSGFDIQVTGFDIDDILFEDDAEEATEPVESDAVECLVNPGDMYQLGKHRLLCGDSTDPEAITKVMGGELADLLLTDPPYNISLGVGDTPEIAKTRRRRTDGLLIENDSMPAEEFEEFLNAAFAAATQNMKPGAAYYVWYPDSSQRSFQNALENNGLIPHQHLIWVKNTHTLGRSDYQHRHEPCYYGWKEGAGHYFIDMRSLNTVLDDIDNITREEAIERLKELSSYTTAIYEDKPTKSELHPTMKPVPLIRKLVRNSSREGDLVLDPFGGSGTTLMACEEQGRRCNMVELDPHYVAVIIKRWEDLTGEKAVKIDV